MLHYCYKYFSVSNIKNLRRCLQALSFQPISGTTISGSYRKCRGDGANAAKCLERREAAASCHIAAEFHRHFPCASLALHISFFPSFVVKHFFWLDASRPFKIIGSRVTSGRRRHGVKCEAAHSRHVTLWPSNSFGIEKERFWCR